MNVWFVFGIIEIIVALKMFVIKDHVHNTKIRIWLCLVIGLIIGNGVFNIIANIY